MSKWLNWKPREEITAKHKAIFLTPKPQKNKKQKIKPNSNKEHTPKQEQHKPIQSKGKQKQKRRPSAAET